jgi:hypothetical protein
LETSCISRLGSLTVWVFPGFKTCPSFVVILAALVTLFLGTFERISISGDIFTSRPGKRGVRFNISNSIDIKDAIPIILNLRECKLKVKKEKGYLQI